MKLISLLTIILFSTAAFSQGLPKNTLEQEKKKIAELEKQLQKKKSDLEIMENTKAVELEKIEAEKKALADKERKIRNEIESESLTDQQQVSVATPKDQFIQNRNWFFNPKSLLSLIFSDKIKYDSGVDRSRNRRALYLIGGRNFGFYEIAPSIYFDSSDLDTRKTNATEYGLTAAINFIENKPGHDLIPFASLNYTRSKFSEDWEKSSSTNKNNTEQINTYNIGGGVKYFPFSQYLSVEGGLFYKSESGLYTEQGSTDLNFDRTAVNANLNMMVYF